MAQWPLGSDSLGADSAPNPDSQLMPRTLIQRPNLDRALVANHASPKKRLTQLFQVDRSFLGAWALEP